MIERWCICGVRRDGAPAVTDHAVSFDTTRPLRGSNLILCRAEFADDEDALTLAQADPRIVVLPAKAVAATRIPQATRDWLSVEGVTIGAGDGVLNVLRGMRDRLCEKASSARFSFHVSERD
jgi:hypothetical protein